MKRIAPLVGCLWALYSLLLTESCKKETINLTPNVTLKADAGPDQTAALFSTVTLDGTASKGDGTLNYSWTYSGPAQVGNINFQNQFTSKATFVPPMNGSYLFTLEVSKSSNGIQTSSSDQVIVTVSGLLTLSGTLTTNVVLQNIEASTTLPDYKITADLIIPTGITITAPNTGIIIEVADNVGIRIQGGGINLDNAVQFTSSAGWKGILLESGALTLTGELQNAGKSAFSGQTEAAAITTIAGNLNLTATRFTSTTATYDLLITGQLNSPTITTCNFSTAKPIKTPIANLNDIGTNNNLGTYDYITLTTPGAGTSVNAGSSSLFTFQPNFKYYIDGDFTASSQIYFQGAANIQMKGGAGILASGGIGSINSGVVLDGLNGAPWKGIAIGGSDASNISGVQIKNAGSDVFNTGAFTSSVKAAVYFFASANGVISNSQIVNSQGYGVYNSGTSGYMNAGSGNTFTNPALPAVSATVDVIYYALLSNTSSFTMPSGVAAVEVRVPNATISPTGPWYPLGGSNYYLLMNNVFQTTGAWTLNPGVNLRFKAGKSMDVQSGTFTAIGTASSPITFDSEAGTSGSWAGIVLESAYHVEYCTIMNGGDSNLFKGGVTPATELANIVFNNVVIATNTFKNNVIGGSAGYGILVESGKQNPDATNPNNSNAFNTNTLGNIIIK